VTITYGDPLINRTGSYEKPYKNITFSLHIFEVNRAWIIKWYVFIGDTNIFIK